VLLLLTGLYTLAPAAYALIRRRGVRANYRALALVIPALVPVMWYIVMANHSIDHTYFTYRSAAAMVLAGYALVVYLLSPRES